MIELKDLFHLPQLDPLIARVGQDGPGLILVAGLDPRPLTPEGADLLPSGRSTIFRMLMRQILSGRTAGGHAPHAVVVAESRDAVRIPRQLRQQVEYMLVVPPYSYAGRVVRAIESRPDLLVIDRLPEEALVAALKAAQEGLTLLSQLDTLFLGAGVARHLLALGAPRELLNSLSWVIGVQRLNKLCQQCKQSDHPDPVRVQELQRRYPALAGKGSFFRPGSCSACSGSGRSGDIAAFDVWRMQPDSPAPFEQPSLLPLEEYVLHLAALGHIPLDDAFRLEADQARQTYSLLKSSERALSEANAALRRKVAEIELANQMLQKRTEALISLQDVSHALIASTQLDDLAARVCRHTSELCGADRSILYCMLPDGAAEILATCGWAAGVLHQRVDTGQLMGPESGSTGAAEPETFRDLPPGIPPGETPSLQTARAGLRVPLIAQHEIVGLMIVQSDHKGSFLPGEIALLQALANQAAVAMQRTGLIQNLQDKIQQLQAAQSRLLENERLEREMELARQVQQSMLPLIFPLIPGYSFAARSRPARQVGGDFYDVLLLDTDRLGIVIGDVSDKGMPAALFMALTRSLLFAEARREPSPRQVLENVHRLLMELAEPNMFVTVFYGVVDMAARRLTYTRAGHDRPILLRGEDALTLSGEGTFIGYLDLDELHLSEEEISLAAGDRLVLYTDGLIDALSADGRRFGLPHLVSLLQSSRDLPPDEACAATFDGLADYQGEAEQYDDMTMLVVQIQ